MIITPMDKEIIRYLQEDLSLSSYPYRKIADQIGIDEDLLLSKINTYLEEGIIRRFGAVVKHHNIGYLTNAMVVWEVSPQYTKEAGRIMASYKEVSHCYERPTYPHWPYNIYTMIHGHSTKECEEIVQQMATATGLTNYMLLYSSQEFKKSSMKYFL